MDQIKKIELSLEVATGNLICKTFDNLDDLVKFLNETARDPEKIREIISPRKRSGKVSEQMGFYDTEEDDDDDDDW